MALMDVLTEFSKLLQPGLWFETKLWLHKIVENSLFAVTHCLSCLRCLQDL